MGRPDPNAALRRACVIRRERLKGHKAALSEVAAVEAALDGRPPLGWEDDYSRGVAEQHPDFRRFQQLAHLFGVSHILEGATAPKGGANGR
jgi:hypothetical protein